MYSSAEEMEAMARLAKERLEQQVSGVEEAPASDGEDIYADFRQYQEDREDYQDDETVSTYTNQEPQEADVDVYYGPLPELDSNGDAEDLPTLSPYDEPLFEGGPGKTQIESWKKEWVGYDIHLIEILRDVFVVRTLNRFEYKQLIAIPGIDALQREEVICQTTVLWPDQYTWKKMATEKAGLPSKLSDIVMERSGFTNDYAIQIL